MARSCLEIEIVSVHCVLLKITDLELASELNNENININTNFLVKISEVLDMDVLNNYNMDDKNDEKFDNTFFCTSILILMSQIQMNACISANMNLTKNAFFHQTTFHLLPF